MNAFKSFVCTSCRRSLATKSSSSITPSRTLALRSISSTSSNNAKDPILSSLGNAMPASAAAPSWNIGALLDPSSNGPPLALSRGTTLAGKKSVPIPHRMHVYATKHNTHITVTQPPKKDPNDAAKMVDVLLSLSAGNIGFRKAGRGSYDAGYQLGAFVLKQLQERGLMRDIASVEVVLRGFGAGREAVTKALLSQEGRLLRAKITSVKDATRLKFGGPRSPKPRRLG